MSDMEVMTVRTLVRVDFRAELFSDELSFGPRLFECIVLTLSVFITFVPEPAAPAHLFLFVGLDFVQ